MDRVRFITYLCGVGFVIAEDKKSKVLSKDSEQRGIVRSFIDEVFLSIHMTPCSDEEIRLITDVMEDSDILMFAENRKWRRDIGLGRRQ